MIGVRLFHGINDGGITCQGYLYAQAIGQDRGDESALCCGAGFLFNHRGQRHNLTQIQPMAEEWRQAAGRFWCGNGRP